MVCVHGGTVLWSIYRRDTWLVLRRAMYHGLSTVEGTHGEGDILWPIYVVCMARVQEGNV